jgi:hypothetical protein
MARHFLRERLLLGGILAAALGGCQRPAGQNGAEANMGGNQALSQNPNAMSDSGMPRTGNASLNEMAPNASEAWSNSSDEIPQPKRK